MNKDTFQTFGLEEIWSLCQSMRFQNQKREYAEKNQRILRTLQSAVDLYAANEDAPDQTYRLAWLLVKLAMTVDAMATDVTLPLSRLERNSLDSFTEVGEAMEMLKEGGASLFFRTACLLQKEAALQLARKDGAANPEGVSVILNTVRTRLPVLDRFAQIDAGFKNAGFLGPLAVSLAALAPVDGIAGFLAYCDTDSLYETCKHLCSAAKELPTTHARSCFQLALVLGSEINWSFRLENPIEDICTAAADAEFLSELLSDTRDLPQGTADSFRCTAALAAYDHGDNSIDPLVLLQEVEDIQARDNTTDTLACWNLNNGDLAGALNTIGHAVTIDGCKFSLIRAAQECHVEKDRDTVATLARRMRKGENAADVFIALAKACADADASTASSLLAEALEKTRSANNPEDRVLQLSEAARHMHCIGCQDTAQTVLQEAIEHLKDIDVDYQHDYALGQICKACAETGHTHRLPDLFSLLSDRTRAPDVLEKVASVCAESGDHTAFAEVLRSCVESLALNGDESPEEDIANALMEFTGTPGRKIVFAVVEDHARRGNLVATIALARALGSEGLYSEALELLRGIETDAPPEPKGIDGTNITEDILERMSRSITDVLSRGFDSQSPFELLDASFEDMGGDSIFDELEPTADDEERGALPAKVIAAGQSLLKSATSHGAVVFIDDLVALIQKHARNLPGSMFISPEEMAGEIFAGTAKQLAELGQIDRALSLLTEVQSEETQGKLIKDLIPLLIVSGRVNEVRGVISSLTLATQDMIRVTIAMELAERKTPGAHEELGLVHDFKTRAHGMRALSSILVRTKSATNNYAELLHDVAVSTAQIGVAHELPDWCFYTVPLALASAGKADDIVRFLDLIPDSNERSDELKTHGLAEGIDVLIENGHTVDLENLIDSLPSTELRDVRRRRLALELGEIKGVDAAEAIIITVESDEARARAQRELVDVLLGAGRTDEAIRVAASVNGETRYSNRYVRDDALKAIVRHCIDAGDMKSAVSTADMIERPWYKMWARAMYVKGLINCGDLDRGLDLMQTILSATREAGPNYEEFHADVIAYYCSECTDYVDLDLVAGFVGEMSNPKWRASAAESLAEACCNRDSVEIGLAAVRDAHAYARSHEDADAVEWALSSIIRAYVACGDVDSARNIPKDARDERSRDQLFSDFDVAVAKNAAGIDDTGHITFDAWGEMVRVVDEIHSKLRRIEACRRLLDLPGVRATPACRDHLIQITLRTFRGLDPRVQGGIREGLVTTLVACGRPDSAAQLVKIDRDLAGGNMSVLRQTDNLAMNIGSSNHPENWIRFLSLIDVPDSDAKQGLLQQVTYHLCQRNKGHLRATEEALEFIRESGLALPELVATYTHLHMAISMLGSEVLPCLLSSLSASTMNSRVSRSAVYAMLAVLIRSGRYVEAKKITESYPTLGLKGVFQEQV